jgi:hypothetical protein
MVHRQQAGPGENQEGYFLPTSNLIRQVCRTTGSPDFLIHYSFAEQTQFGNQANWRTGSQELVDVHLWLI